MCFVLVVGLALRLSNYTLPEDKGAAPPLHRQAGGLDSALSLDIMALSDHQPALLPRERLCASWWGSQELGGYSFPGPCSIWRHGSAEQSSF